jgi:hypothetical protein
MHNGVPRSSLSTRAAPCPPMQVCTRTSRCTGPSYAQAASSPVGALPACASDCPGVARMSNTWAVVASMTPFPRTTCKKGSLPSCRMTLPLLWPAVTIKI